MIEKTINNYYLHNFIFIKKQLGINLMRKTIILKPIEMTETVMQSLENMGKIIRLYPNRHLHSVKKGENLGKAVYESNALYGPHKLLSVTIDRPYFLNFGTHPDNEEFLLIGDPGAKPMYLNISLCNNEELDKKIADHQLTADDFICLHIKYNDPNVSFFTMLAGIPHGEAVADVDGQPASFYVTEPRDLSTVCTNFGDYEIRPPQ